MKAASSWTPTKFERGEEGLRGSRDHRNLGTTSRFAADLQAAFWVPKLREHARGILADLGCGTVPLYGEYKDLVTETICVDWAQSKHENPHLDYECDLTQRLPLDNDSVDTIVLSCVLEHIPEPTAVWREMHRILRPAGKVLVCVPFLYPLHELPHDYYRYTEFGLRRLAEMTGFDVISLEPIGGAPEVVVNIVSKLLGRIPRIGRPIAAVTQDVAWRLLETSTGRRLSRSTAKTFPLSYFLVTQKR
jgi:ubiquinone/menaquinone biosynthesis C-methylase UbiE